MKKKKRILNRDHNIISLFERINFLEIPQTWEEEINPIIFKLKILNDSPLLNEMRSENTHESKREEYLKEIGDFMQFIDTVPDKYIRTMDSEIDLIRHGDIEGNDLIKLYTRLIPHLIDHLERQIHMKYCKAIDVMMLQTQNVNSLVTPTDMQNEWTKERPRKTESTRISDLPKTVLISLSLENHDGTLNDLSLRDIQNIARRMAVEVSRINPSNN